MKQMQHMQTPCLLTCLLFVTALPNAYGNEVKEQSNQTEKQHCETKDCANLEHIQVNGQFIGIEVPEVIGRAYLNRDFINATPKGNGDINELIALLPGVQLSDEAMSIDSLAEITAPEISISGAQPWQTGFSLDGMNYNNRVDPATSSRLTASANDVSGGVQTMNVNSDIVDSITVYDHNIPAEYGDFSGGIVDVKTKSPFLTGDSGSIAYRTNQSDWGQYHVIQGDEERVSETAGALEPPSYTKENLDLSLQKRFNKHHGVLFSVNYMQSEISDLSLQTMQTQKRTNINSLIKYSYRDGWIDKLDLTAMYSPYQSDAYLKDVAASDYKLEGGNMGLIANFANDTKFGYWDTKINYSRSDSSREGPEHYFSWLQIKGKEWGQLADQGDDIRLSQEGGYGNLDTVQDTINIKSSLDVPRFEWLSMEHDIKLGGEYTSQSVKRDRDQDSYNYNAPQYIFNPNNPLDCNGYTLDCVQEQYRVDLTTLAEQFGGTFNFNDPEQSLAYAENTLVAAQYFSSRQVTPQEHIDVSLSRQSLFITDSLKWWRLSLNLGLRYDYDDFLKNHNIAPRLSVGYDIFDDGNTLLTAGANRYYDASLMSYKIREQQRFSYREYRPIRDSRLQGWQPSAYTGEFKYQFDELDTPYDDEIALGLKHATQSFGNFSGKYVRRLKKQQFSRVRSDEVSEDGYKYIRMTNNGTGSSKRYSIAWDARFAGHSLWANVSYSENKASNLSYDADADNTPLEALVYYQEGDEGRAVSLSQLQMLKTNFASPVIANIGWNVDWLDSLSTGLSATYKGAYDNAVKTTRLESYGLTQECSTCAIETVYLSVYEKREIEARIMVGLNLRFNYEFVKGQNVELRADITNLFNARTNTVTEGFSGVEPGRMYWLGASYNF